MKKVKDFIKIITQTPNEARCAGYYHGMTNYEYIPDKKIQIGMI